MKYRVFKLPPILMLALAAAPSWAVNKCVLPDGRIALQDLPCAESAKSEKLRTNGVDGGEKQEGTREQNGARLCEAAWRDVPNWKDPESVRITNVRRTGFTTIPLHGTTIMAVHYMADVNARNSYGGYVGRRLAACYLDQSETRVLKVFTPN